MPGRIILMQDLLLDFSMFSKWFLLRWSKWSIHLYLTVNWPSCVREKIVPELLLKRAPTIPQWWMEDWSLLVVCWTALARSCQHSHHTNILGCRHYAFTSMLGRYPDADLYCARMGIRKWQHHIKVNRLWIHFGLSFITLDQNRW